MTPQEISTFITFTANIISKDMSSDDLDRLADCFYYLANTLYLLSSLTEDQENLADLNNLNNFDQLDNLNP
ncbi:MAG: hypothetical protein VB095_02675 [Anaerovorax sp.]|nr:hypothetical protein [Anaerovorax sp.]